MSAKWYYEKHGVRHGPVSSDTIRSMAADGSLSPTDLLWKEGMTDWMPAGKSAHLFPPRSAQSATGTPTPSAKPSRAAAPPDPDTRSEGASVGELFGSAAARKEALRAIGDNLKTAGTLVQKQAYRTKLRQVDLPRAFAALGETVYSLAGRPAGFADAYARIDSLKQQAQALSTDRDDGPEQAGFGGKAKRLMADVNDLARRKIADSRIGTEFTRLGEGVLAQARSLPGCEQHVTAVDDIRGALERLETDIRALSRTSSMSGWLTPYRVLAAGAAVVGLVLAGFVFSGSRGSAARRSDAGRGRIAERGAAASPAAPRAASAKPEIVTERYKTGEVLTETPKVNGRVHGTRREYYRSGKLRAETVYEDNVALHTKVFRQNGGVYLTVDYRTADDAQTIFDRTMRGIDLSTGPDGEPVTERTIRDSGDSDTGKPWRLEATSRQYDYDPDMYGFHGIVEWTVANGKRPDEQLWDNDLINGGRFWRYGGSGRQHFVGATIHGPMELRYPDGSTMLTMWYLGGMPHGLATVYYPVTENGDGTATPGQRGQKKAELMFVGGQGSGTRRLWYADGTRASETEIVGGRRQGVSRDWYDNGQFKTEEAFQDDEREGEFTWWWPNGRRKASGTYARGELHGRYTAWDSDGNVREKGDYIEGKPKPSRTFAKAVAGRRGEGFEMAEAALPRGGGPIRACGCSIGYRSSGDEDEVLAVIEIKPVAPEAFGGAQAGGDAAMVHTYLVAMACKSMFVAVLGDAASRVYGERLTYLDLPGGQRGFKDTRNGRTTFTGLLVVGDQTCVFDIPAETRRDMNNDLAFLRCGKEVTTLGLPSGPEMKYAMWSAARRVFSGGQLD